MYRALPPDFRDRSWLKRRWIDVLILLRVRSIKAECCESFRKEGKMIACKGCAMLYDRESAHPWYRFLGKIGKRRVGKAN